jgi:hypothetical protein
MKEIIIIKETWWASVIKDTFTFGTLFLFYWVNYIFLGNSTVIAITISICFFIGIAGKAARKPLSVSDAIEKLNNMKA